MEALAESDAKGLVFQADRLRNGIRLGTYLVLALGLIVGVMVWLARNGGGERFPPGVLGGVAGGFAATAVMRANRYGKLKLILEKDRLVIIDSFSKKSASQSMVAYKDMESVVAVPGKGVGLRLLRPLAWLHSFNNQGQGLKLWTLQRDANLKSKGVDLWFPNYALAPEPDRFAQLLKQRIPVAASTTIADIDLDQVLAPAGPAAPGAVCAACKTPITGDYWELNKSLRCGPCMEKARRWRESGNRWMRGIRALLWGGLGAAAGGAIFAWIAIATGYELGLISLVAGFLCGAGVKKGSGGRGGWVYQTLAVVLAYTGITLGYGAVVGHAFFTKGPAAQAPANQAAAGSPPASGAALDRARPLTATSNLGQALDHSKLLTATALVGQTLNHSALLTATAVVGQEPLGADAMTVQSAPAPAPKLPLNGVPPRLEDADGERFQDHPAGAAPSPSPQAWSQSAAQSGTARGAHGPWFMELMQQAAENSNPMVRILIGLAALLAISLALPFLIAFKSPITLAIIAIALYQAWVINKRRPFDVKGPFTAPARP
jgi:hypothetical protein